MKLVIKLGKGMNKKYRGVIGFNPDWSLPYYWFIEDPSRKIIIEPYRDYKSKHQAITNLRRWIARLHIDCNIVDEACGDK